jgi:hypothetical protein
LSFRGRAVPLSSSGAKALSAILDGVVLNNMLHFEIDFEV